MFSEVITTHEKVFLRSFRGGSYHHSGADRQRACRGCSCMVCVVVSFILLMVIASVVVAPSLHGSWSLRDDAKTQVSVMSKTEQRRLILIARQDCFRLSQLRDRQIRNGSAPISGGCEVTWDGILCWDLATPRTTVSHRCPDYIHGFNKNGLATRYCTENGTWFYNTDHNDTWTNYTQCLQPSIDLRFHAAHGDRLRLLYTVGYSVSLGTLLIAVIIMLCCKRLQSKSNTLHINLFLAFILRAVIAFLKDLLFVNNLGLAKDLQPGPHGVLQFVQDSVHWECKLLFTLFMYAISACNIWILSEALYLTMLVHRPLRTERQGVRVYVVIGWALPLVFLIPWVIVKATKEDSFCWNIQENPYYYWIVRGPGVAVIVINFFLFLNIFRKLFLKIRHSAELGASGKAKYRKLAKFILVLIPLFGIMYMVFYVVVPSGFENNSFNVAYLYLEMAYNSFQGFLLALLFCFLNEEVHGELKRMWYRHRYRKGDPTAFTRSFAFSSYRNKTPASTPTPTTSSAAHRSQSAHLLLLSHPFPAVATVPTVTAAAAGTTARPGPLRKLRSLSSSSSHLDDTPQDLLTVSEKRRMRMKKARSHDLDHHHNHHPLYREVSSSEAEVRPLQSDSLLRQAIKGNALAKRAAFQQQRTLELSVFDGDGDAENGGALPLTSPLTSPTFCAVQGLLWCLAHWRPNIDSPLWTDGAQTTAAIEPQGA
ncbi:secretin receptor-like [Babylonia areolata]|uniref:secretin receptor-like n=1 Tax=Babylonia areolata TaxID=304850 RepID=UPI003FD23360